MSNTRKFYSYCGAVLKFDTVVAHNWKGETFAETERKAKSNLAYQFKKAMNYPPSTPVKLVGKLKCVEG